MVSQKRLWWGALNWAEIQSTSGSREACSRQRSRRSVQGPITGRTGYLKVPFFLRFSLIYWTGNTQMEQKSKVGKGTESQSPFLLWLCRDSKCLQALLILLELLSDTSTNVPFSCLYKIVAPAHHAPSCFILHRVDLEALSVLLELHCYFFTIHWRRHHGLFNLTFAEASWEDCKLCNNEYIYNANFGGFL